MADERPRSARADLREATAAVHERLHHVPMFAALAAGRIERSSYVSMLGRLHGFHMPLEAAIADAFRADGLRDVGFAASLGAWQRAALLRQDLLTMGISNDEVARLPFHSVPKGSSAPARAMGWLYVLEGSTLGGRLLVRNLDEMFPQNTNAGRLFLLAGANPHHIAWKDMCSVIEECGSVSDRRAEMISGAIEAFAWFERWFDEGMSAAAA